MPPSPIDGDEDEANRLTTLAKHAQEQGDYTQALPLYQRALAIREQVLGPNHLEVATSLDNLAKLYQEQTQQSMRQSELPLHERVLAFLQAPTEEDQAMPLYERALGIREEVLGPDHPDVATSLDNLAHRHQDLGQALASRGLFALHQENQKMEPIHKRLFQPYPPEYLNSLSTTSRRCQEEYSKALSLYQRALAIRQRALGPSHPDVATSLTNLSKFYKQCDSQGKALQHMEQMAAIREQRLQEDPRNLARMQREREIMMEPVQDADEVALPYYEQALAILEQTQPDHPNTAEVLQNLAVIYWHGGRSEEAFPLWERALAIHEQVYGPTHLIVADDLENLADRYYQDLGQHEYALALYQRVLTIREQAQPHEPETADVLEVMADILDDLGQSAQADELRARGQAILDQQDG